MRIKYQFKIRDASLDRQPKNQSSLVRETLTKIMGRPTTTADFRSSFRQIIHNSHFKRRVSLEEQEAQKEDRFLRGRQIAYLIFEQFRVTGANDSVENYADLFTVVLGNDDIQEIRFEVGRNFIIDDANPI